MSKLLASITGTVNFGIQKTSRMNDVIYSISQKLIHIYVFVCIRVYACVIPLIFYGLVPDFRPWYTVLIFQGLHSSWCHMQVKCWYHCNRYIHILQVSLRAYQNFVFFMNIIPGSYDHTSKLYDARTKSSILTVDHGQPIESILVHPSGSLVFTAGQMLNFYKNFVLRHLTSEPHYDWLKWKMGS